MPSEKDQSYILGEMSGAINGIKEAVENQGQDIKELGNKFGNLSNSVQNSVPWEKCLVLRKESEDNFKEVLSNTKEEFKNIVKDIDTNVKKAINGKHRMFWPTDINSWLTFIFLLGAFLMILAKVVIGFDVLIKLPDAKANVAEVVENSNK